MVVFGERLKSLRLQNHLQQEQVARLVGVERSTVSMWENDLRQPSYATLVRLADVYGVTTDFLLGRTNNSPIDLSGLTIAEAALISQLVASMTTKNENLEELRR